MVNEISSSKKNLVERFNQMAVHIKESYGINIWLAEIMGRRWSYLEGNHCGGDILSPPQRIVIDDRFGIVSDGWNKIPSDERIGIIQSLQQILKMTAA